MPHVYDGKERPDSGPFRRPDDYTVSIWKRIPNASVVCAGGCVGFKEGVVDTRKKAGEYYLKKAIKEGVLKSGDRYDVDVSEDASDEWETVLTGTVE